MKKEIMIGIVAVFLIFIFAAVFLGQKSMNMGNNGVENQTNNLIIDLDLQKLPVQPNNPNLMDGAVWFAVKGEGNKNTLINFTSLAIHSPLIDKWVILSNLTRELEFNQAPLFSGVSQVDAMIYNGIYLYFPSATVNEGNDAKNVLMFKDRIYLVGEFIRVFPMQHTYAQITLLKNESFLKTTDGENVFVPKIKLTVWINGTITRQADDTITQSNGTLWSDNIISVSKEGEVGAGYMVKSGDQLVIGNRTVTLA